MNEVAHDGLHLTEDLRVAELTLCVAVALRQRYGVVRDLGVERRLLARSSVVA